MASPDDDHRVADLDRYRKARERARKAATSQTPPRPPGRESFLGGRRHAGRILVIVLAVLAALYVLPMVL